MLCWSVPELLGKILERERASETGGTEGVDSETDERRIIPKTTSLTGRNERPVCLQNDWLFSRCVSFFKNGRSK